MLFALHRKPIIKVALTLKQFEERNPCVSATFALHEGRHVSDKHETVACSRQQDVQALWGSHESDVARVVASGKGSYDDLAFLTLEVVCVVVSPTVLSEAAVLLQHQVA